MTHQSFIKKQIVQNLYGLFFICGISFLFGIIFGIHYTTLYLILIGLFLFIIGVCIWNWRQVCFSWISIFLGYWMGHFAMINHQNDFNALSVETNNFTQKKDIIWEVDTILFKKAFSSVYRLNIKKIDNDDIISTWYRQKKLSIFVEIPSNLHLKNGDIINFQWKIEQNIHFPIVGYDRYTLFQWWYGLVKIYTFKKIYSQEVSFIQKCKTYWQDIFRYYFPDSVAGTLLGMTIGSIDLLSGEVKNDFIKSGISHILVVSGSNIAFLILFLTFFMKYIPLHRFGRVLIIWGVLIFYGSLVWWWISVIRAIIMWMISYIAVEHGKKGFADFALLFSCIILTLYNPLSIVYDAGFWLSFGATFGIIVLHPYIESFWKRFSIPQWIASVISISIGASFGSLPALIYHFGSLPVGSILINILIWWVLGWILFTSVFLVGIYSLSHFMGYLFWYIIYLPTKYIIFLSDIFANSPILIIPDILKTPLTSFILWIYTFIFIKKNYERTLK